MKRLGLILTLLLSSAVARAEFTKGEDYKLKGIKDEVILGGRGSGKGTTFVPEMRASYNMDTKEEQHFFSAKRTRASVRTAPVFEADQITSVSGTESDVFKFDGSTLTWDVAYTVDPRGGSKGDFTEGWTLQTSPGVYFSYQRELTPAEIATGLSRPENVAGSYAVLLNRSGNFVDNNGKTVVNYGSGKLAHIYRPFVSDAIGNKVWGTLDITNNVMTVTIPGAFLDAAVFPVTLDPDFGYTSMGASGASHSQQMITIASTPTARGTITSYTVGWDCCHGNSSNYKVALYKIADNTLLANSASNDAAVSNPQSDVFITNSISGTKPNLLPEPKGYYIASLQQGSIWLAYDDDLNTGCLYISGDFDYAFNATGATEELGNRRYSIYATYSLPPSLPSVSKKNRFFWRRVP